MYICIITKYKLLILNEIYKNTSTTPHLYLYSKSNIEFMSISCSFSLSNIDLHKYARLKRAAGKLNVLISVFPRLHLYIGHLNYKQHKLYSIVTFLFSSQLLEQTEKKKESVGVFCLILKIEILYNIKLAAVVFI